MKKIKQLGMEKEFKEWIKNYPRVGRKIKLVKDYSSIDKNLKKNTIFEIEAIIENECFKIKGINWIFIRSDFEVLFNGSKKKS